MEACSSKLTWRHCFEIAGAWYIVKSLHSVEQEEAMLLVDVCVDEVVMLQVGEWLILMLPDCDFVTLKLLAGLLVLLVVLEIF